MSGAPRLGLAEYGVKIGEHPGGVPVLGADDFAEDLAATIDDVGFGVHDRAVVDGGFLAGVAGGGIVDAVLLEKSAVGGFVFIDRDTEDDAVTRGNALLEVDEGGSLFNAGRAPGGPEIEDDNFALVLGKGGGLAVGEGEIDVFGRLSGDGGFTLAVVGKREECEYGEGESHAAPSHDFAKQGIHIEL